MSNALCELVARYVQVVNRALYVHNQRFPYKWIADRLRAVRAPQRESEADWSNEHIS